MTGFEDGFNGKPKKNSEDTIGYEVDEFGQIIRKDFVEDKDTIDFSKLNLPDQIEFLAENYKEIKKVPLIENIPYGKVLISITSTIPDGPMNVLEIIRTDKDQESFMTTMWNSKSYLVDRRLIENSDND